MSFDLQVKNGDVVIGKDGDLALVQGQSKLIQDLIKICQTDAGALPYAPWYGSFISKTLIGSVLNTNITIDIAKNQLQNSIENLKKLQQLQVSNGTQALTLDEQLSAIMGISISRNTNEPRAFDVSVSVLSKGFNKVNLSFSINNL